MTSITVRCEVAQRAGALRAIEPFAELVNHTRYHEQKRELVVIVKLDDVLPAKRDDQVEAILAALERVGCKPPAPAKTS